MAVLEIEKYNKIIENGKKAIQLLNQGDLNKFFELAESAWNLFPEPKENWNQAYGFSKMIFNHSIRNNSMTQAKKWLNRMIKNNNNLNLFPIDIDFNIGKYYYENKENKLAYEKWKFVVKESNFRYFENENPKYLDFYKNYDKLSR